MHWGADILADRVESLTFMLPFISFLIIFLLVVITIRILAYLVKKTLDLTILGTFDDFAGAVLGMLKWAFMLSLLIWVAQSFGMEMPEEELGESSLFPVVEPFAPAVIDVLGAVTPAIKNAVERVNELIIESHDVAVD